MKKPFAIAALLISFFSGSLAASSAQATRIIDIPPVVVIPLEKVTYDFVGACIDCARPVTPSESTAHLTLQGYIPGNAISLDNFFSFTYDGSPALHAFTILGLNAGGVPGFNLTFGSPTISGTIPTTLPGAFDFLVSDSLYFFSTSSDPLAKWSTGMHDTSSDEGTNATWTLARRPVPEPASIALFGFGIAAMRLLRRRRKTS
jgi:hypothetical protein